MTAITLDQADRLIDAILKRGAELDCRPLSVIVVEPGCKVKAFKKEDGSSMIRFEMAYGKDSSSREWDFNEDGDLNVIVKV